MRDPIAYAQTKFGEDTLIGSKDIPSKWNSKKRPYRFQGWPRSLSENSACVTVQNFSEIGQLAAE